MALRSLPKPLRDGAAIAAIVLVAYSAFFVARAIQGHAVRLDQAALQVAVQTVGWGLTGAAGSWVVRRLLLIQ